MVLLWCIHFNDVVSVYLVVYFNYFSLHLLWVQKIKVQ